MELMDETMIVRTENLERTLNVGFEMICTVPGEECALTLFLAKIDMALALGLISGRDRSFLERAAYAAFYEGRREVRSAPGR